MIHSKCEHPGRQSPISNSKLVLFNLTYFVRQVLSEFPQNSEVAWLQVLISKPEILTGFPVLNCVGRHVPSGK